MLVLRLIRFITGFVSFAAEGGFPERFINLCRLRGIQLWELKCRNGVITACTDCKGYLKIRPVARKSGMRVRIKNKHGLPFFLNRHSRRFGILIGICFCVAALSILSTRIWSIDVVGNASVPSEKIIEVFEELGVKKGAAGEKINISAVEISALRRLPDLSWLNINISGSAALIEVREREGTAEKNEDNEPSDIIAARDGQIVILRPFNGTQEQKIGNPVLKGDLLISGIEENKDLTVSFCRAKGYVVARTNRSIGVSQSREIKVKIPVKEKKSYIIDFLFFSIPLGKTYDNAYKEERGITVNGVTLPVGFTECVSTEYAESTVVLSQEQTALLAALRFCELCTEELRYLKVEESKISFAESEKSCSVGGKFVCLENIGEERKMQIEETEH
ncbi:MAG: sporulation protein YqfD [Clostridia bacterium]|nr:sporulation protein YqfD [Clostridia bacterium]